MAQASLEKDDFLSWLQHPATQALHRLLQQEVLDLKEQWVSGAFTDQSQYGTAILNAKAIGRCEQCERVLTLEFEDMEQEQET